MKERNAAIAQFLNESGCRGAKRKDLFGDASTRRYERIFPKGGNRTLILMDAPVEKCEPLDAFVEVADFLTSIRLPAPRIHGVDRKNGLMLLEDFGDDLVARVIERNPDAESEIYETAIDLLVEMQSRPPPDVFPHYSPEEQANLSALSVDWYRSHAVGDENSDSFPCPANGNRRGQRRVDCRKISVCSSGLSCGESSSGSRRAKGCSGWGFWIFRTDRSDIRPMIWFLFSKTQDATSERESVPE